MLRRRLLMLALGLAFAAPAPGVLAGAMDTGLRCHHNIAEASSAPRPAGLEPDLVRVVYVGADGAVRHSDDLPTKALFPADAEVSTTTPWTKEAAVFAGPRLADLAAHGGLKVSGATLIALNAYSAYIPAADWSEDGVILATHMNGQPMSVDTFGPAFVVYPLASNRRLDNQEVHAKMVWQVMEVRFHVED